MAVMVETGDRQEVTVLVVDKMYLHHRLQEVLEDRLVTLSLVTATSHGLPLVLGSVHFRKE
jgi:hypothetical protein